MSDLLVRQFFHLSKNHAPINAEPQVSQNKHNNKTNSQLLHVAGYYYLLSQIHKQIYILVFALGFAKMESCGAIQVLRNADGGGGCPIFWKKHYEGVRFNIISVTRGWVGANFQEKSVR